MTRVGVRYRAGRLSIGLLYDPFPVPMLYKDQREIRQKRTPCRYFTCKGFRVERKGVEPSTSAVRLQRSPN